MSDQTYGNMAGVNVTATGGSVHGVHGNVGLETNEAVAPGIRLWGHHIVLNGENGIKCEECEMEEEIPEIFQQTSGFREVVYKLYVLFEFKHESCISDDPDHELLMALREDAREQKIAEYERRKSNEKKMDALRIDSAADLFDDDDEDDSDPIISRIKETFAP